MKFLSLFSGIEAASVAWKPIGWECVGVAEVEPFPCAALKHHYPDVPNLGDVTKITQQQIEALGHVDLIAYGFPCQDLSVAGNRKGLQNADGTNTRSGLFYVANRIAGWSKARWSLAENVPGLFSSNEGRDFASVVGELSGAEFDVPADGWPNSGVALGERGLVEWVTLDAQFFGVPQRRRRIFIVRDTGDWQRREPLFLIPQSLQGHSAPSRQAGKDVAGTISSRSTGGGGLGTDFELGGGQTASEWPAKIAPTLNAHFGDKQGLEDQHVNGGCGLFIPAKPIFASDGQAGAAFAEDMALTLNATNEQPYIAHSLRGEGFDASERAPAGKPLAFLMAHAAHSGDDCVLWPYAKLATGYGSIDRDGKTCRTHRVMCELAHGNPPAPDLDAAHSCGVRDCINPRHLRWASRADNMADTIAHGTAPRGESHGASKLTEDAVREIFGRLAGRETQQSIADDFGVSRSAISDIAHGKNWAWLREDGTGRGTPLVPVAFTGGASDILHLEDCAHPVTGRNGDPGMVCFSSKDHGADAGDIAPTLRSMGHDGSHANGGGQVAVCFDTTQITSRENRCNPKDGDPCVATATQVRRLTVKECSRLQGFPDDYLDIIYRGKPAADGPKYKALGNSWAVPVASWVGERIAMVEALTQTGATPSAPRG